MTAAHEFLIDKGVRSIGEQHSAREIEEWLYEFSKLFATEQLSKAKEASCILTRNDLVEWFDKKIEELKSEL